MADFYISFDSTPPGATISFSDTESLDLSFQPESTVTVGGSGDNISVDVVAGISIEKFRVVSLDDNGHLIYADTSSESSIDRVLGLSKGIATIGEVCSVVTSGRVRNTYLDWNWGLSKPIYLSIEGAMTQTIPSSGWFVKIGYPISENEIVVSIGEPIEL